MYVVYRLHSWACLTNVSAVGQSATALTGNSCNFALDSDLQLYFRHSNSGIATHGILIVEDVYFFSSIVTITIKMYLIT